MLPCTLTVPEVGLASPAMIRISVDLPAPFSPVISTMCPAVISRVTPRSAANRPKTLVILFRETMTPAERLVDGLDAVCSLVDLRT